MMFYFGVTLGGESLLPRGEESHVKAKWGSRFRTVPTPMSSCPHSLALTHGSSLLTSEAALLWVGLCPLKWQLLLVMLQGGEARILQIVPGVSSDALEGGCGPEGVSWVPEPQALVLGSHPQALLTCRALEQSVHTHSFGIFIWAPTS